MTPAWVIPLLGKLVLNPPTWGWRAVLSKLSATSHTEFLIQILYYGLIIRNSRKPLAGAATAGDHFENSICKYEWCTSLQ